MFPIPGNTNSVSNLSYLLLLNDDLDREDKVLSPAVVIRKIFLPVPFLPYQYQL